MRYDGKSQCHGCKHQMVRADRRDPEMATSTVVGFEHQVALKIREGQYARVADELADLSFDMSQTISARCPVFVIKRALSFCTKAGTPHTLRMTFGQSPRSRAQHH